MANPIEHLSYLRYQFIEEHGREPEEALMSITYVLAIKGWVAGDHPNAFMGPVKDLKAIMKLKWTPDESLAPGTVRLI